MAQSFNTSLKNVAILYAQLLKVKVTTITIKKDIEENPYYPSLLSLSDTFTKHNIPNGAYTVAKEDFSRLQPPFIAFVSMPDVGRDFVLVTDITDKTVTYLYAGSKATIIKKEDFLQRYQKIVWAAEPNERSGETDYFKKIKQERSKQYRKIVWITAASIMILLAIIANISVDTLLAFGTIALIKLIGTAAAVLLLVYEMDKNNVFVKNICSAGGKINCDAVLSSKASKIGGISWAEIGFFYFAATTIWLLLPGLSFSSKILWLAIGNMFAAPYILFSIYYQWRVIKQWCPLCLIIQSILVSELIWNIVFYWNHFTFPVIHSFEYMIVLLCVLFPIVIWYGLKPIFKKAKDHNLYAAAYRRLQYNPNLFNSLLQEQTRIPDGWQQLGITVGNTNATTTIIKVCNPYCNPCAEAHPLLEKIIARNSDVQVKILFVQNKKNKVVVKHLLAIAADNDRTKTQQALDDWYLAEDKNYGLFAAKYPFPKNVEERVSRDIEVMDKWCNEAEVMYTPTIFINGHRMPENYTIMELDNIL